jgi:hypothetical protein
MAGVSMEDRVAIQELYARMLWALNNGDPETIKKVHDPEMVTDRWDHAKSGVEGPIGASTNWPSDPVAKTRQHHITTFIVDPDSEGRDGHAQVRFYFLVTEVKEPPRIDVRWTSYSRDTVRKNAAGEWVIWQRDIKLPHNDTA